MLQYEVVDDPERDFNERLRMETGWGEVAEGLTKVLMGYAALFLGVLFGAGLVAIAVFNIGNDLAHKGAKGQMGLGNAWMLYIGLGILSVIGLISYCVIVGGQFKCMMGAAERNGSRWFMFMCIACILFMPAFEIANGIANWQMIQDVRKNPALMRDFELGKLNPMGQWLHLIAFGISMLYPLFFLLFLRSVAVCLRADMHAMLVTSFLVLALALVTATGYALYQHPPGGKPMPPEHAVMLAGGWGILLLTYVALILVMRVCIHVQLARIRSPLEM